LIGIKERKTLNAEVMDLLLNTVLLMYWWMYCGIPQK
jgi:hypothetical protein